MIAQFEAQVTDFFDWREYLEGSPRLRSLPLVQQRELIAAYLDANPADIYEVFAHLPESVAIDVADLIRHPSNAGLDFHDALLNAGIAALSLDIDDYIERMYSRYVDEYGIFSPLSRYEPSELIGWRDESE